ncbi:MAG: Na+:solute symporter [Microbacterium sp.]|uniref:sodium:solute symporter family protein n=1 Tax=Microbacterium sp. TaxID=51671 RepID=UPI001D9E5487|nr:sodium:solute symporter family protein [Microbacterium sp.]MBW8761116.1 Na+:solute symporter [Microbacterium sp.]
MNLHLIDALIIGAYLTATIAIGFWISKRASRSIRNYFLGGNQIPWYVLGVSDASGMFDVSGTMWMVYLLFVYGLKSIWIPWLWPVFNQIILMAFLSTWLRRSGVMTGAEWIRFRFGEGRGARLAHLVVIVFALLNVIGFLAYAFIGIGKFASTFLPWALSADPTTNAKLWGLVLIAITTVYVAKGGMFSVVFTEILQFSIMTVASISVGVLVMRQVSPETLNQFIPAGWRSPWFGRTLDLDWTRLMPAVNQRIATDGWTMFSAFWGMLLFKGLLQAGAGPAPNYDMQRILSTRSPKDAAKMNGLVNIVLLIPRYMLITGLTVLALAHFSPQLRAMGENVDFELVLPLAMRSFIPTGLLGLLIAALLAAFMSNFAATVNAAPAYIVNDIYKRYIRPEADQRTLVRMSYVSAVAVVVVGTAIGLFVGSLNTMVQWIVSALYGGYTASNLLKWYWWRFNAYGYFWGMAAGIAAAALVPLMLPNVAPIFAFPAVLALSLVGCIAGTLLTPPDDAEVLERFYLRVRPWGFWRPVHARLAQTHPGLIANTAFKRDMFNVAVGIVWQTALTATGIFIVLRDTRSLMISASLVVVTAAILKLTWYDKLEDYPADLAVVDAHRVAPEPEALAATAP